MTGVRIEIAPGVRMLANGRLVVVDADVERGFAEAVQHFGPYVRSRAKRLAGGDHELAGELAQEALIKLWELDPLRFSDDDESYVRSMLANHMVDLEREWRGRPGQRKRKVKSEEAQPEPAPAPETP